MWPNDDANQCLHNRSGSHGVPNANLFNFANKLQQKSNASSREDYIPQTLTVLFEIHRVYIWPLWPFVFCLLFVNNSEKNVTTPSTNQRFWPDSGQILNHQYRITVAESQALGSSGRKSLLLARLFFLLPTTSTQTFLLAKRPQRRGAGETAVYAA